MIYEKSTGRLRLEIFWLSIPDLYVGLKHYITLFIRFIVLLLIIPKLICRVKTIPIKMPALCVHICFICKCRGHTLLDVLKKSKKTGFINCVYRNEMLGMIDYEFKVEFLFCWDKKKHLRGDNSLFLFSTNNFQWFGHQSHQGIFFKLQEPLFALENCFRNLGIFMYLFNMYMVIEHFLC